MRDLTAVEIQKFAARTGVRKIAVENFLGTIGRGDNSHGCRCNLYADAAAYRWNAATVAAILAGIKLASK